MGHASPASSNNASVSAVNGQQQQSPQASDNNSNTAQQASRPTSSNDAAGSPVVAAGGASGSNNNTSSSSSQPANNSNGNTDYDSPEQALLASFKAAAQSVTQLYRDSLKFSRTEHAKGYQAALQDLLTFISTHPVVQEKKQQGRSEDEIRQTTSLSVDDIVGFIREAQARNCSHLNGGETVSGSSSQQQQLHAQQLQQQQQQQQHEQMLQQQQQQQQALQQQLLQSQMQHHQQHQQQQQQHSVHPEGGQTAGLLHGSSGGVMLPQATAFPVAPVSMPEFPSEPFTFTAPIFHPAMDQHTLQGPYPHGGLEGGIGQQTSVDSLKRRYALQDYSNSIINNSGYNNNYGNNMAAAAAAAAAGRMTAAANAARFASSPMHLDSLAWNVDAPAFKRTRRREGE